MREFQFVRPKTAVGPDEVRLGWARKGSHYYYFGGTQGFIAFISFIPEKKKINVLLGNIAYNQLSIPWLLELGKCEMNMK